MENDQPPTDPSSTAPQLPTAPEHSEMKNKKKSITPMEDEVSVVGSSSTSSNNQARSYQVSVVGSSLTSSNNQARSYECIFCKRGFANAQALGGHMNIHRKDKEKLKHQHHGMSSIDQAARLMDVVIPRMIQHRPRAPPPPPVVSWGNWMIQEEGKKAEVKGRNDNDWLSTNSEEEMKLPLFVDRPINKRDREEHTHTGDRQDEIPMSGASEDVDKGKSSSEGHGSSDVLVVDLELRLGPEPPDPSPQPLSTRKFF